MTPDQARDEARARKTLASLWVLVHAATEQSNAAERITRGLIDAQEFLQAVQDGLSHPLLEAWRRRSANRPPPTGRDQHRRRLVCLLCIALERSGLGKEETRSFAAQQLQREKIPLAPSHNTIKHWQQEMWPPLAGADEQVVSNALNRADGLCGEARKERIANYFVGLIKALHDPLTKVIQTDS
jgi:hypothetical protein